MIENLVWIRENSVELRVYHFPLEWNTEHIEYLSVPPIWKSSLGSSKTSSKKKIKRKESWTNLMIGLLAFHCLSVPAGNEA